MSRSIILLGGTSGGVSAGVQTCYEHGFDQTVLSLSVRTADGHGVNVALSLSDTWALIELLRAESLELAALIRSGVK